MKNSMEVSSAGMAVPPLRIGNAELPGELGTNDEWIRSHTGIGARHLASAETAASDLALEAARDALAGPDLQGLAEALDIIVVATATPDYPGFPSTACIVQDKLGAVKAAAMDISAGCTGFIYALETAAGLLSLRPERRYALVIGVDILSRLIDWKDRSTCVLFGDGAGAVLMEKTDREDAAERRGLLRTILGSDGSGADKLCNPIGGSRTPFRDGLENHLRMDGRGVYNFAVKSITDTIEALLAEEGIGAEDLDWIVPHQANARIIQAAARRLGMGDEKFFLNIEEYANTSAASIPIALSEMQREGRLRRGGLVMTVGFGAGLTYGGNLIRW